MRILGSMAVLTAFTLFGCGGGNSDDPETKLGSRTLVKSSIIPASEQCTSGGLEIAMGTDLNGNGSLEPNEITGYQTICNGSIGNASLIDIKSIPSGAHCANGGSEFTIGMDVNGDSKLSESEIIETSFMCNSSGHNGNDDYIFLVRIRGEGPGESCDFGGSVVLVGSDNNRNGVLDNDEVITQHYTCYNQSPGENVPPTVPALTIHNTAINTSLTSVLSASDIENDRITYAVTQNPTNGQIITFNSLTGEFTYQPNNDYSGVDTFYYVADDGKNQSTEGEIRFNISDIAPPKGHFLINTNNIQFIDYPDGITSRTFSISGKNIEANIVAYLASPAAISALNLKALADKEDGAIAPSVSLNVAQLPKAKGTTTIEVTLVDGSDVVRSIGERQVTFSYVYDWISDGTTLEINPTQNGTATATYYTKDGELAVRLKLENDSSIFSVDANNSLLFNVASLFDDEQLGVALSNTGMRNGYYSYKVNFSNFPAVDSYGENFTSFSGGFNVTDKPVPLTQNVNKTLLVRQGQLIQQSVKLTGYGGTGPLVFSKVNPAITGTATLTDPNEGMVVYAPLSPDLLVDDAFSYKVNDSFLDSNVSKVRLNITDDTATETASLKAIYNTKTSLLELTWLDKWQNEIGFKVEKYRESCDCWETAELLAYSPESGLPLSWKRNVSERTYYRVFAMLPDGDALLKPGVVVANADYHPTVVYDQSSPVVGLLNATISDPSTLISNITWYVDLSHKCTGTEPSCRIDTTRMADGIHSVIVRAMLQQSSYIDVESSFSSNNPAQIVSPKISQHIHTGSSSTTTPDIGDYEIQVSASDDTGISYLELQMDDMAPIRLTAPNSTWYRSQNYCKVYPNNCKDKNAYTWPLNNLLPGSHFYTILAESNRGEKREIHSKLNVPISIDLLSPSNSDVKGNTLRVLGNIGTTNNPVRITVTLGSINVLDTTGKSFDTNIDMQNIAEGTYSLRITVKDVVGGASATLTKTLHYRK